MAFPVDLIDCNVITFAAVSSAARWPAAIAVMAAMLIVAPAMCVWVWVLWRRRAATGGSGGGGDPVCGACGYPVRGLSTFQCPECGADLREVGMVRPRAAGGLRGPIIAWTVMWALLGFLTMPALEGAVKWQIEEFAVPVLVWSVFAWFAGLIYMLSRSPVQPANAAVTDSQAITSANVAAGAGETAAVTRNLSIMFVDVEAFTALAAKETRDGLIVVIRKARELVKPAVARRGGRLVKTMGDGFLITFDSPTNAVLAARDVQVEAAHRAAADGDTALRFRIGVSTGEVTVEADDVFGDPVNLAARLQQLAPPGAVYFSESTYHAMTKSEVAHAEAGEFEVKGVAGRVKVYRATR